VYSWRILVGLTRSVARIPRPLLPLIAVARARGRQRLWTAERYGSPLEAITQQQADSLGRSLRAIDSAAEWRVHVAYEFRRPLLGEVLSAIPADDRTVVVPVYAADSAFTHALSRTTVATLAQPVDARDDVDVLPALDTDVLGAASATHVIDCLRRHPDFVGPRVALVLAAHGTLLDPPAGIDTGLRATERLREIIERRLAPHFGLVVHGWLNHTRGGRWTEPPMDLALKQVADMGFSKVVYFPFGFLADNAESQLEGRLALRAHPNLEPVHLPCLNTSPLLVRALAEQILAENTVDSTRIPSTHSVQVR
jgi:protoheme ferro-lyase